MRFYGRIQLLLNSIFTTFRHSLGFGTMLYLAGMKIISVETSVIYHFNIIINFAMKIHRCQCYCAQKLNIMNSEILQE